MKVLVACEFSGTVRDAFIKRGHDAISCDLLPTESPGPHLQGDLFSFDLSGYDLIIAHPPCTFLTCTGNKWMKPEFEERFPTRQQDRKEAIEFFMKIVNLPCNKIAIENPIGIMSTEYRKPDQIIQPYYFGDEARKPTCLWLKNLPLLQHFKESDWFAEKTHVSEGEIIIHKSGRTDSRGHYDSLKLPAGERSKVRSKTFQGIADAMAKQWSLQCNYNVVY